MALIKRVHCLADIEPAGYHGTAVTASSYAVNLNLECEADAGFPDVTESAGRDAFAAFLESVRAVRFHLFRIDVAQGGALVPSLLFEVGVGANTGRVVSEPALPSGALLHWLDEAAASRRGRYWVVPPSGQQGQQTVDERDIGATHELRSAHGWNAPVGHRLGLTHLLHLPVAIGSADPAIPFLVVLPAFGDAAPVPTHLTLVQQPADWNGIDVAGIEVTYDSGVPGLDEIVCRASRLTAPLPAPGLLTPSGYLAAAERADDTRRLLDWFEARAVTLTSPALGLARRKTAAGTDAEGLFAPIWTKVPHGQDPFGYAIEAPNAAWRAVAALCIALDALVIGMLRPPRSPVAPEGELLSVLVSAILAEFDDRATAATVPTIDRARRAALVTDALRDFLLQSGLFAEGPKAMASALRSVHDLREGASDSAAPADLLLDTLLSCFAAGGRFEVTQETARILAKYPTSDPPTGFAPDVLAATAACETRLHDRAGFQRAILRLFETAVVRTAGDATPLQDLVAPQVAALIAAKAGITDNGQKGALVAAVAAAWAAFRAMLDESLDGAEAARRSAGSALLASLLGDAGGFPLKAHPGSPPALIALIQQGSAFAPNLRRTGDGCFGPVLKALPRPPLPASVAADPVFGAILEEAHASAMKPLLGLFSDASRFVPDHVPAPLPLQVAQGLSAKEAEDFAAQFNGIAVAIRRKDADDSPFAYLNLARLTWSRAGTPPAFADAADEPVAIHPLMPTVTDGRTALFVNYEGFPFASAAFDGTIPNAEGEAPVQRRPYYAHDVADHPGIGFATAPALAYGRTFETLAFATTNAGSLPKALQLTDAAPWRPWATIETGAIADVDLTAAMSSRPYQRRTAIGRIALEEVRAGAAGPRIGGSLPGVQPLANDYPRLGVASTSTGAPGVVDLMRLADGTGALAFPAPGEAQRSTPLRLADPAWLGGRGKLKVELFGPEASAGASVAQLEAPGLDGTAVGVGDVLLSLATRPPASPGGDPSRALVLEGAGPAVEVAVPRPVGDDDRFWLRLALEPDAAEAVALSFAEPEGQNGAGHSLRDVPLLLLAPPGAAWKGRLSQIVQATIAAPRTGFLDFERWCRNKDLQLEALGAGAGNFLHALLTAYLLRHRDSVMAAELDGLPDPSVAALRLTLVATDRLGGSRPAAVLQREIPLAGRLMAIAATVGEPQTVGELRKKLFKPLKAAFTFTLTVSPGALALTVDGDGAATVSVPEGMVAQLSVAPLVEARHFASSGSGPVTFPAVFHEGLLEHVVAPDGARHAFPETVLRIETMADWLLAPGDASDRAEHALALAQAMIGVVPAGAARRYALSTKTMVAPAERSAWRIVGEIDVATQRWRPTGRPAYHLIDPRAVRDDGAADPTAPISNSALPLKEVAGLLGAFEGDAFFDRSNVDADTATQRLAPLPASTVLHTIVWDPPSATYFRHRFTLRSRYAGALSDERRQTVAAWMPGEQPDPLLEWTLRVAMLADASRLTVTRPQVRGLVPLTASPSGDDASTPPILAILQEPPFARAGLADRIAAEVGTGFGYRLEGGTAHIDDSRKEIGPSPHLTYRPLDAERALGIALRVEGPIGLTFDRPDGPAPAFANAMMMLAPVSLWEARLPPLEEHFMGITLRRYLDPAWVTGGPTARTELETDRSWWIELPASALDNGAAFTLAFRDGGAFLSIADGGTGCRDVAVATTVLDPLGRGGPATIPIARVSAEAVSRLIVLHQPLAPGHASTSMLGVPRAGADVEKGRSASPLVLASFEWSPSKVTQPTFNVPQGARAWAAMASAPTSLAFTRPGLDHDRGRAFDLDPDTGRLTGMTASRVDFSDLTIRVENGTFGFRRGFEDGGIATWLCSSTMADNTSPVHVHRHLAVIMTRFADGPGRPVEAFCRADLAGALANHASSPEAPVPTIGRLIEFETPAMVLTDRTSSGVPATYRSAYFDLVTTGYDPARPISLFIRFVGPPSHLRRLAKLKVFLKPPIDSRATPPAPPAQDLSTLTAPLPAADDDFALALRIGLADGSAELLGSDGRWTPVQDAGFSPWRPGVPGFVLTLEATSRGGGPPAEFWADASLLHSSAGLPQDRGTFDFNWLFSPSKDAEPAEAVRPPALDRMTEAQARIVAMSPPMPLTWT